jgi:hypothetical protein
MSNTNPNVVVQVDRAFVSNPPAAPSAGTTTVIFATHPCTLGTGGVSVVSLFTRASGLQSVLIDPDAIEEIDVTFGLHDHASAANGLRAYYTKDGGTTWTETDMKDPNNAATIGATAPVQVPTLAAGAEAAEIFRIGRYRGFALTYTAGTPGPTANTGWDVNVSVQYAPQEN